MRQRTADLLKCTGSVEFIDILKPVYYDIMVKRVKLFILVQGC